MSIRFLIAGAVAGIGLVRILEEKKLTHRIYPEPIRDFDVNKYLGKWYEVVRMDNRYERYLNNTTAHYSLNSDDTLTVINRGYHTKKFLSKEVQGIAKFRTSETTNGALEVSFWGPFFSDYTVVSIDDEYKSALVVGKNVDFIWFLSRETTLPDATLDKYIELAADLGYNVDKLLHIEHDHVSKLKGESLVSKAINAIRK